MTLRLKLTLTILPLLLVGIVSLGWWHYLAASSSVEHASRLYLDTVLNAYFDSELKRRQHMLERLGVTQIQSFNDQYQQEAIEAATRIADQQSGNFIIFGSDGRLLHATGGLASDSFLYWVQQPDVAQALQGDFGSVELSLHEKGSGLLYVRRGFAPWGWQVFYAIDNQSYLSDLNRILLSTLLVAGLLTLITTFFLYIFARAILLRPIEVIGSSAESIARGEKLEVIPVTHNDELGGLARNMEVMARAINATQEELERQVRDRTAELLQAQRIAKLGYWRLDLSTGQLSWSDEVFRIMEMDPAEITPSYDSFLNAIHPDDREKVDLAYRAHLEDKQSYDIEHRVLFPDGRIKYVREQCESEYDVDGKPLRSLGTVHDITDRVRMEKLMVQTEKMMSVGGLAAGMAHELNNPLGGVLQGVANVQRRLSPEFEKNRQLAQELDFDLQKAQAYMDQRGVTGFLEGIADSGQRAARIVSQMLQFSRKSEVVLRPERLDALIENSLELASVDYDLKKKYDFRAIEIQRDYQTGLPPVPCIAAEIQQVLLNVLRNAALAMYGQQERDELARITIRTIREGEAVKIEVEDNGPGMDEPTRQRVFEPFFTTREPGEGTGLGLSVSYFIIHDEHGGEMRVESSPGNGAKFVITLPLHAAV